MSTSKEGRGVGAIFRTAAHAGRGASAKPPRGTADENVRSNDFSRSARATATKVATTNLHIFRTDAHAARGASAKPPCGTAHEKHRCSRRFREPAAGHGPAQSREGSFLSRFVAYFQVSLARPRFSARIAACVRSLACSLHMMALT